MLDPEEDDEIEPLAERIDLGLVATEALALALPAYPRKPGAELGPAASAPPGPAPPRTRAKPFAALAALRGKLGERLVRPAAIGACADRRNRYVPRFVFLPGPAARGRDIAPGICQVRRGQMQRLNRAAARLRSRSRDGCSEEQGHALAARHAPVA